MGIINNDPTNGTAHSRQELFSLIPAPIIDNNNLDSPLNSTSSYSINNDADGISDFDNITMIPGIDNSVVYVFRGDAYRKVLVTNPNGVSLIQDYSAVNYSQKITPLSNTSVEVEQYTKPYIETNNEYPILPGLYPVDVQQYLLPVSGSIQSDNPQIISLGQQIVNGSTNQTQIIENTILWLQNNIDLNAPSTYEPQDALSVLLRGTAVCMGYANLTAAILRSVGIPTKVVTGCAGTIGHAWNETYFHNIGWFPTDANMLVNWAQFVMYMPGAWCDEYTFQEIERQINAWSIYSLTTPYEKGLVYTAENPLWNRVPFNFTPSTPTFIVDKNNPVSQMTVKVDYGGGYTNRWIATTTTPWLSPSYAEGYDGENIAFSINMAGYPIGTYLGEFLFKPGVNEPGAEKTMTITVHVVYKSYLPVLIN